MATRSIRFSEPWKDPATLVQHHVGDVAVLDGHLAAELIAAGWAVDSTDPVTPIPDPLPQYLLKTNALATYQMGQTVQPSGDVTGATDAAAINAALLGGGKRVNLAAGGAFYLNAPIYVDSNSVLDAYGATVTLPIGVLTNMIRTKSVDPSRTVTDAAATATSTTLTSATAAFTAGDVGATVQVVGAANNGASWYGTITAVTNATTVTVSNKADTTVSGQTLNIYNANARCKKVTIRGGSWIVLDSYPNGHLGTSTALNSFATCIRRVDGLTVRDMAFQTAGTAGQGGKFTLSLADVTDFTVDNIKFNGTCGDGVHVTGPASNGRIEHVTGTTGDDMVVISAQDNSTVAITDTQGSLDRIRVKGIHGNNTWNACKLYDLGTVKKFTWSQITVDDIKGTAQHNGFITLGDFDGDELRVTDVTVKTGAANPIIDLAAMSHINGIFIDGVTWRDDANAPTTGIVKINAPRGPVTIRNVRLAIDTLNGTNAPAGTCIGVYLTGNFGGSTFGSALDIQGVWCARGAVVPPATFHAVFFDSSSTGTVTSLAMRAITGQAAAGVALNVQGAVTFLHAAISDSIWLGDQLALTVATTPAFKLKLSGVQCQATNIVRTLSPITVELVNVEANTSGPLVAVIGAPATPVVLYAANFTQAGAGANATKDGTQTVTTNVANYTTASI